MSETSPTAYPIGAPLQWNSLRFDSSRYYPTEHHYNNINESSSSYNIGNIPPMAASGSYGGLGQPSRKRKNQEQSYPRQDKRVRQDYYTQGQGTSHDPLEIESSPEPEATHTSSRQAAGPAPFSGSVKNWGLYVDGSARPPKFYAIAGGHVPGIYGDWDNAEKQLKNFKKNAGSNGNAHKSFKTLREAWAFLENKKHIVFEALTRPKGSEYLASIGRPIASVLQPRQPTYTSQRTPSSPPQAYIHTAQRAPSYTPPHHHRFLPESPLDRSMPSEQDYMSLQNEDAYRQPGDSSNNTPPAPQNLVSFEPEPTLSAEQQLVVDLILQGENVFYTGSAGCGKSTILKAFVKQLKARGKRIKITAPTNLAALNVGGQTTWNFAGWTPDSFKNPLEKLKADANGKEVWKRFDSTDVLVIDEISMVENHFFERLNEVLKHSRAAKSRGPFGGVQLVVTGDFCQLSPVKPFRCCIGCGLNLTRDNESRPTKYTCGEGCKLEFFDIDKWAFRSKAWEECNFRQINLTKIHRQTDKKFISILQRIRLDGTILPNHANILLNHTSETEGAIELFAKREDVERVNNENIRRIPTQEIEFKCHDDFNLKDHEDSSLKKINNAVEQDGSPLTALKGHRYEISVTLKQGMRVVLQANVDPGAGLVNGSQGTIIGFERYDENKLPRTAEGGAEMGSQAPRGTHAKYAEIQIEAFAKTVNDHKPWPVVRFDNGAERTIYADCTVNELGNKKPYSLLSRTQIPLMAGYACTVHKSQGMTLDRVVVNLARAFEPSQIYVALSRARSLAGLKVLDLPRRGLGGANPQVREFMASIVGGD